MKQRLFTTLFLVVVLCFTLACAAIVPGSADEPGGNLATAIASESQVQDEPEQIVEPTAVIEKETEVVPTEVVEEAEPDPQETAAPTEAAQVEPTVPAPDDHTDVYLQMEPYWVQDGTIITVISVAKNPTSNVVNGSEYTVTAFDKDGAELLSDYDYVEVLMPNERLAVIHYLYLSEGQQAADVKMEITPGEVTSLEVPMVNLALDKVTIVPGSFMPRITGTITNNLDRTLNDMRVLAVTYDAQGNINGGGYAFLDFLDANGTVGMDVPVDVAGEAARAEMFVELSTSTMFTEDNSWNDLLRVFDYGFTQNGTTLNVGIIVENDDLYLPAQMSQYHITAYAADGTVVDFDSGYINVIFPAQQYGIAHSLYFEQDIEVERVEVGIYSGYSDHYDIDENPLSLVTANLTDDDWMIGCLGKIANSHTTTILYPEVVAIAYDADGNIIGAGSTSLDEVPAGGEAEFELYMDLPEGPDEVSVFAQFGSSTYLE